MMLSMTGKPEGISVVIPVRDCESYLGEAIASVLAQTIPPGEVVVVDDASSDRSRQVAVGFGPPVRVVRRAGPGLAPAARNDGVAAATGSILAFLDADDTWAPDRLASQLPVLTAPGAPDLVFGHVEEFVSPELSATQRQGLPAARGVVPGRVITTMLVWRSTFERVGRFDPQLPAADFLDWLARARALGLTEAMLDGVVAGRRIHPGNTQWSSRDADVLRALRASLQRRGAAPER